jgi:hypothetical protein
MDFLLLPAARKRYTENENQWRSMTLFLLGAITV